MHRWTSSAENSLAIRETMTPAPDSMSWASFPERVTSPLMVTREQPVAGSSATRNTAVLPKRVAP